MEILLATNNRHKRDELAQMLPGHDLLLPQDAGYRFECEETGRTYLDNALLKAETLYRLSGRAVLSDDSGLSVTALGGAPGIHSARFGEADAGRPLSDTEKTLRLLDALTGEGDRSAFFVCCLVFMTASYQVVSVQQTLPGRILSKPRGAGGFGYDPVFCPEGHDLSLAELSPGQKNALSHRGKGARLLLPLINAYCP